LAAAPDTAPFVLKPHRDSFSHLVFTPAGRWLVSRAQDDKVREDRTLLWNLNLADPSADPIELPGYASLGTGPGVSSDGRWLVTNSREGILLWDLTELGPSTKSRVIPWRGNSAWESAISPDSHWLVATSGASTFLWDLTAPDPTDAAIPLPGGGTTVHYRIFSPDSRWLLTVTDAEARLWTLHLDDLINLARRRVGRNMTRLEWKMYFGNQEYHQTFPGLLSGAGENN
jgi:WD40 repeat protein